MKGLKIVSFEQGLDYVVQTILKTKDKERPILISIHGNPNAGKTEFIKTAVNLLFNNFYVLGYGCVCRDNPQGLLENDPDFLLIDDLPHPFSINRYTKGYFSRPPNFSVYLSKELIKNLHPELVSEILEDGYNLIIENPDSKDKYHAGAYEDSVNLKNVLVSKK